MKKIFNFRPAVSLALFFVLGILLGFTYLKYGVLWVAVVFSIIAAVVILCFIFSFIHGSNLEKRNTKHCFKSICEFCKKYRFYALIYFITSLVGVLMFFTSLSGFNNNKNLDQKIASVTGKVVECYPAKSHNYYYVLEDLTFVIDDVKINISERAFLYIEKGDYDSETNAETGQTIVFKAKINYSQIFEDGKINSYGYRNNIKYNFFLYSSDSYKKHEVKPSFFLSIRKAIKKSLSDGMEKSNAKIAYALITGDSLLMDKEMRESFADSGISHVFSVSGLHISVLVVAMVFLLKRLKIKNVYQIFIIGVILLFYAAICGFTPSVIRALVMAEVILVSLALGKKYDLLSSLAVSVIIILSISPLMLFEAGFLMSVSAVLGIILLYRPFDRLLRFLPTKVRAPIVMSLVAQIGVLPILAVTFNQLPVFSLILNVLFVPLISVAYVLLMVMLPICILIPALNILYFVPKILVEIVKGSVAVTKLTGLSVLRVKSFGVFTVVFYLMFITLSPFVFIKTKKKTVLCIAMSIIFVVGILFSYVTFSSDKTSIAGVNADNAGVSLIRHQNKNYLVVYDTKKTTDELERFLFANSIKEIEMLVFAELHKNNYNAIVVGFVKNYSLKIIVMPYPITKGYRDLVESYADKVNIKYLLSKEVYIYNNINFCSYYYGNTYCALRVDLPKAKALYLAGEYLEEKMLYVLNNSYAKINFIFGSKQQFPYYKVLRPDIFVTDFYYGEEKNIYSQRAYGDLIFLFKDDKIVKKYSY